jgi:hypothetical protein
MRNSLKRIEKKLHSSVPHMEQFHAVCELERLHKIKAMRPLIEKKLKEVADDKSLDIYARQRANHILNPIQAIPASAAQR